jgi:rhodanese-related sulfurtransferase
VIPFEVPPWALACGEATFDLILDLREPDAFTRGHLAGARNLPYGRFQAEAPGLVPEGATVLVVDPGGARAAELALWLRGRGIPAAFLGGGLSAWTGPLVRGSA